VGGSGGELRRHLGVWQATALNVTRIVGAGVFLPVPLMLRKLPGPYALLGWWCCSPGCTWPCSARCRGGRCRSILP